MPSSKPSPEGKPCPVCNFAPCLGPKCHTACKAKIASIREELAKVTKERDDALLREQVLHILSVQQEEWLNESNRERDAAMWAHAECLCHIGGDPESNLRDFYTDHSDRLIAERAKTDEG